MKNHAAILQNVQCALPPETAESLSLWNRPVRRRGRTPGPPVLAQQLPAVQHIELNLHDINQLFNTMDPSPFHQKDLDRDAEEFILGWVQVAMWPLRARGKIFEKLSKMPVEVWRRE